MLENISDPDTQSRIVNALLEGADASLRSQLEERLQGQQEDSQTSDDSTSEPRTDAQRRRLESRRH